MKRSIVPIFLVVTFLLILPIAPAYSEEPVNFPDENLEQAIRSAIDKTSGNIYPSDLDSLTQFVAEGKGIEDLTGMEYCDNLIKLDLWNNQISELSPLSELTKLETIDLWSNKISDLTPLSKLNNLKVLWLNNNEISNLSPLQNLTQLEVLLLGINDISNLSPLSELTSLRRLELYGNAISDISPLSGLVNLTALSLGSNTISNISNLSSLTALQELALWKNHISDLSPIAKLSDLNYLYMGDNNIADLSPLKELNSLRNLWLNDNKISDLSPLTNLTELGDLEVKNNDISDIKPLVENGGFGEGDDIDLRLNNLDVTEGSQDREDIQTLVDRGINVKYKPQKLGHGFEEFQDLAVDAGDLSPGESKVTQIVEFNDDDEDSDPVNIGEIQIRSEGTATGADIEKLEVVLTVEDKSGSSKIAKTYSVDSFPMNVYLGYPEITLSDDISGKIELKPTISDSPTKGHTLKTQIEVEQAEGGVTVASSAIDGVEEKISSSIVPVELSKGWNLFSPPGSPVNSGPATSLGGDIDQLSLFYDYSPSSGYTNYPNDTTATQLNWKKGYWVYVNSQTPVDMATNVPTGEQTIEFTDPGWHMIGFPYNVDWSEVSFSDTSDFANDGADQVRIVSWSPDENKYLNHYSGTSYLLSPWAGFWVKIKSTPASIAVNEASSSASSLNKASPLPLTVDPNELDYPPKPPAYSETDTGLQGLALPNPVSSTQEVVFRVIGSTARVKKLRTEVFDANGSSVWSGEAQGTTLTWKPKGAANGIYLYKSAVKVDGQWEKLGVAKLLVVQ